VLLVEEQNFEKFGFASSTMGINLKPTIPEHVKYGSDMLPEHLIPTLNEEPTFYVKDLPDAIPLSIPRIPTGLPTIKQLSTFEVGYYSDLVRRYGQDYRAMERDIKLNYMQHTRRQLEKNCLVFEERYKSSAADHNTSYWASSASASASSSSSSSSSSSAPATSSS